MLTRAWCSDTFKESNQKVDVDVQCLSLHEMLKWARSKKTMPCCLLTWEFSLTLEEEHRLEVLRTETWGYHLTASERNEVLGTSYLTNWMTDGLTKWLSNYMVLFEKLIVFKTFPTFYETRRLITVLPVLSYMSLIYTFPFYLRFISIRYFHLRVGLRSSLFTSSCHVKRTRTFVLPILPQVVPISFPFILLPEYYLMSTSYEAPRYAIFFRSRITFSFLGPNIVLYVDPIRKHPQPVFSAKRERQSFTQQNTRSSVKWIFILLDSKREDERLWSEWHQPSPEFSLSLIPSCMQFWVSSVVSKYLRFVTLFEDFI